MKTLIIVYALIVPGTGVSTSNFTLPGLSSIECQQLKQDFMAELKSNDAVILSAKCIDDK